MVLTLRDLERQRSSHPYSLRSLALMLLLAVSCAVGAAVAFVQKDSFTCGAGSQQPPQTTQPLYFGYGVSQEQCHAFCNNGFVDAGNNCLSVPSDACEAIIVQWHSVGGTIIYSCNVYQCDGDPEHCSYVQKGLRTSVELLVVGIVLLVLSFFTLIYSIRSLWYRFHYRRRQLNSNHPATSIPLSPSLQGNGNQSVDITIPVPKVVEADLPYRALA
jgi:hypothetical protein